GMALMVCTECRSYFLTDAASEERPPPCRRCRGDTRQATCEELQKDLQGGEASINATRSPQRERWRGMLMLPTAAADCPISAIFEAVDLAGQERIADGYA